MNSTTLSDRRRLRLGPFLVDDLDRIEVVERAVDLAISATTRPVRAYGLHVGGLNYQFNNEFTGELEDAELVYADGGSVVLLSRLAGAGRLERSPTTDIGWDVLRRFAERQGRPARIAMIGGPPGLAHRAGQVLACAGLGELVFEADGYPDDWSVAVERLSQAQLDVCVVGLGAPREMLWVRTWLDQLPPSLILTCGGWFGFLAGEEKRGRGLLRAAGLEWISRVAQSPRRLAGRYVRGAWSTLRLARSVAFARVAS